jgi:2,5-diketo-D-gluconate reductase B
MTAPNQTTETIEVQGTSVPLLGFGTWQIEGSDATEAVRDALEIGYRQIDTARAYGNEAEVGAGIASSGVDRADIFLTTKIFPGDFAPEALRAAAEDSLRSLKTDYVDLLLLHWPDDSVPLEQTLAAMVALREAGKIRQLGVSNFPTGLLEEALQHAPVFCNQVEYHPVPRPGSAAGARPRERRARDRLLPARPRPRGGRRDAGGDRRVARQVGRPGRAALAARAAGRLPHPEGVEPRAPRRELRGLRLRAQRRGAQPDRGAPQGRPPDRP